MAVLLVYDSPAAAVTTQSVPTASALPANAANPVIITPAKANFFISLLSLFLDAHRSRGTQN